MARGKQTCKILKEIRRQIAEANDIEFVTSECRYKGDCLGSCPKCEAEVRYLEQQLRHRQLAGKLVNLAGISAGAIAMLAPIAVQSQTPDTSLTKGYVATQAMADTIMVKGVVFCEYTAQDGSVVTDTLIGAIVRNINSKKATRTNINGEFEIDANIGDSIQVSYVGFNNQIIVVSNRDPLRITLNDKRVALLGEVAVMCNPMNTLDLIIINEDGELFSSDDVIIKRVLRDGIDEDDLTDIYPSPVYDDNDNQIIALRIYWNDDSDFQDDDGKPLKEVVLRIEVEGYDNPKTIKVKYPKRNAKKPIKFKHEKKK